MKTNHPILTDKVYDLLSWLVKYVLPGLGTLYFGLSEIWGFPYGVQVVGTLALVATFLGGLLFVSKKSYYDSDVRFDGRVNTDGIVEIDLTSYDIMNKDEITLKVENDDSQG